MLDSETENKNNSIENTEPEPAESNLDETVEELPEDGSDTESDQVKKTPWSHTLFEYFELFVTVLSIVFLFFMFIARHCVVNGSSMEKTLSDRDIVICSDLFYEPQHGDVVVIAQTGSKLPDEIIVKRIIGLPGDTITIDYGMMKVYVNGEQLVEYYAFYDPLASRNDHEYAKTDYEMPIVVPEGCVFVMGDNRYHSTDSRHSEYVGFVDQRRILGKVIIRIFPIQKFGILKDGE